MKLNDRPVMAGPFVPTIIADVEVDPFSAAIQTIDIVHFRIHAGKSFFYNEYITLASAATRNILVSPSGSHMLINFQSSGEVVLEFFEGTAVSDNGTQLSAWNRNRFSTILPATVLYHTPTITNDGTRLVHEQVGKTGGVEQVGGGNLLRGELVLKTGLNYLLRLTSNDNNNDITLYMDWYEL